MEKRTIINKLSLHIKLITLVFFISLAIGIMRTIGDPDSAEKSLSELSRILQPIGNLPNKYLFLFIFVNNSIKAFLSIFLFFFFGAYALFLVIANGNILGQIFALTGKEEGWLYPVAGILPHGIIEIPTVLFSASLGLRLGISFYGYLARKSGDQLGSDLENAIKIFSIWLLPSLLIAALIETFVTPHVMDLFR